MRCLLACFLTLVASTPAGKAYFDVAFSTSSLVRMRGALTRRSGSLPAHEENKDDRHTGCEAVAQRRHNRPQFAPVVMSTHERIGEAAME